MSAFATINIALKELGIDADDARDLYERHTGVRSLRVMTSTQHEAVIGELRRLGFKGRSKPAQKRAEGPFAGKLQALWIAMWNLGLIADRSDAGLTEFVKRQTRIDHTRFLRYAEDADAVIEALKGWMARERKVDWRRDRFMPAWTQSNGWRIAEAQFRFLRAAHPDFVDHRDLQAWLTATRAGRAFVQEFDDRAWISVMNELGVHVRHAARPGQVR